MHHEIRNIDCIEGLNSLPRESVDLIITSPPYNLSTTTGGGFPDRYGMWQRPALKDGYEEHDDAMTYTEYVVWMQSVLCASWDTLKPTGAIYFNHKPRIQAGRLQTALDFNPGLPVRQIIIWDYRYRINYSTAFFAPGHEWIVIFAKDDYRLKNKSVSAIGDVWSFPTARNNPHPAPFPLKIPTTILSANDAKLVVDPFCGSGTTGVACAIAGVNFIGFDKSAKYCRMADKRIQLAKEGIVEDWHQHFDESCVEKPMRDLTDMFV